MKKNNLVINIILIFLLLIGFVFKLMNVNLLAVSVFSIVVLIAVFYLFYLIKHTIKVK